MDPGRKRVEGFILPEPLKKKSRSGGSSRVAPSQLGEVDIHDLDKKTKPDPSCRGKTGPQKRFSPHVPKLTREPVNLEVDPTERSSQCGDCVLRETALREQQKEANAQKARDFIEGVLSLQKKLVTPPVDPQANYINFGNFAVYDMLFLAQLFFEKLDEFRRAGKPVHVDIGYHYTKREYMEQIKTGGLLSKAEREASSIQTEFNGATFGDGIYTACNPFAYHGFAGGDIGLLVLRLKGHTVHYETTKPTDLDLVDTVLGRDGTDQVTVLRSSAQCVALVQYQSTLVSLVNDTALGNKMVYKYHCMLQELVDRHFNDQPNAQVEELVPSQVFLRATAVGQSGSAPTRQGGTATEVVEYKAPESLGCPGRKQVIREMHPSSVSTTECVICLEQLKGGDTSAAFLSSCSHEFHLGCIRTTLEHSNKCPVCRKPVSKPTGKMPSGKMEIERCQDLVCDGFDPGVIVIWYEIQAGTQKPYHENPGALHSSTSRVAYIPDNNDGRSLLKRLKYAFSCGLTFTVGTSLTTGIRNTVTWSSIHHKTSLSDGVHGFPDDSYFYNVNEELDSLNVPAADDL